jgi:hypothetical protein
MKMKKLLGISLGCLLALPLSAATTRLRAGAAVATKARIMNVHKAPAGARARALQQLKVQQSGGTGLGVELPVIAKLVGSGNTPFYSALDVNNYATYSREVDFYLDGADLKTGETISVLGIFSNDNSGTEMVGVSNLHFDDIVDAIVQSQPGNFPADIETDGFLGSMLVVFNENSDPVIVDASAQARLYSYLNGGDGTTGVASKGHVLTANEPQSLVGAFRDVRGQAGVPQIYSNLFINNLGFLQADQPLGGDTVRVRLTAYSNTTGQQVGQTAEFNIGPFQTASFADVLNALHVPTSDDTVIVFADVISGQSDILGIAAYVDDVTKDPSGFELNPVE